MCGPLDEAKAMSTQVGQGLPHTYDHQFIRKIRIMNGTDSGISYEEILEAYPERIGVSRCVSDALFEWLMFVAPQIFGNPMQN